MLGYPIFLLTTFLSLTQFASTKDVYCESGKSRASIIVNSGDRFAFATKGDAYQNRIQCLAIYKLGTCSKVVVDCPIFNTRAKSSRNTCRGDKLLLSKPQSKWYCRTSGPSNVIISSTFKMRFVSNARGNARGVQCEVRCADTTTEKPDTTPSDSTSKNCMCGLAKREKRIVGGHETEVNEYPWQVALYYKQWFNCGGSVISNRWVLSAAHCMGGPASNYKVRLGEHDRPKTDEANSYAVKVEDYIVHNGYNSRTMQNDFALLKLEETIDFATHPHIRPVCLPDSDAGDFDNELATVSGWGRQSWNGYGSNVLLEVEVKVMSNDECKDTGYWESEITNDMVCAGVEEGGKDSCQGDSGGPLVTSFGKDGVTPGQNYDQIGVVSWGLGCADARFPGVYSRVTEARDWIDTVTKDSFTTCPRQLSSNGTTTSASTTQETTTPKTTTPQPTKPSTTPKTTTSASTTQKTTTPTTTTPQPTKPSTTQKPTSTKPTTTSTTTTAATTSSPSKSCKCGLAQRATRIVGGSQTEVNEYPWQVAMYYGRSFICGGSVISDRWVLTAAHCVQKGSARNYKLRLGEHHRHESDETESITVEVKRIVSHKSYDSDTLNNDYALMELKEAIDFSEYPHIRPICLPSSSAGDFDNSNATVTGWGTTGSNKPLSSVLLEVDVKVLSVDECKNDYGYKETQITEEMLCAAVKKGGKDSCQGDSGGPLITSSGGDGVTAGQNYHQIGVVSWGRGCALAKYPGVYARVTKGLTWIEDVTGDSFKTCPRT